MNFENAVGYVHSLLAHTLIEGDVAIDATMGNGWDTAFMANAVGSRGVVYGFDIQPIAVEVTKLRVKETPADARLFLESHEHMSDFVAPEHRGRVKAITFNLGYLPGGDKEISTIAESTVNGLLQARTLIASGGLITVVCYRHAEGERELQLVRDLVSALPQNEYSVVESSFVNQRSSPPVVFAIASL